MLTFSLTKLALAGILALGAGGSVLILATSGPLADDDPEVIPAGTATLEATSTPDGADATVSPTPEQEPYDPATQFVSTDLFDFDRIAPAGTSDWVKVEGPLGSVEMMIPPDWTASPAPGRDIEGNFVGDTITVAAPTEGRRPHEGSDVAGWSKVDLASTTFWTDTDEPNDLLRRVSLESRRAGYTLEVLQIAHSDVLSEGVLALILRGEGESGLHLLAVGQLYYPTTAGDLSTMLGILGSITIG